MLLCLMKMDDSNLRGFNKINKVFGNKFTKTSIFELNEYLYTMMEEEQHTFKKLFQSSGIFVMY